jgi:hypothetical protein
MTKAEARAARKSRDRERRGRRARRYDSFFAPWALAIAGLVMSLAFLFQPRLPLKVAFLAFFFVAALVSGKKVSIMTSLAVSVGIVAANLLVPIGRVMWRAGPIIITETALLDGINKAVIFEGLIYISKATIRQGLRLPGRFGSIVGRAFVYYDRILEYRGGIRASSLFQDADSLMLSVWEDERANEGAAAVEAARPVSGYAIAAGAALLALCALASGFFFMR